MRILQDFKIPNFKFPKLKMEGLSEIDESSIEAPDQKKKEVKYEAKNYKTIKEVFNQSTTNFKNKVFILEKFDHKEPFTEISYEKYRNDVTRVRNRSNKIIKLKR